MTSVRLNHWSLFTALLLVLLVTPAVNSASSERGIKLIASNRCVKQGSVLTINCETGLTGTKYIITLQKYKESNLVQQYEEIVPCDLREDNSRTEQESRCLTQVHDRVWSYQVMNASERDGGWYRCVMKASTTGIISSSLTGVVVPSDEPGSTTDCQTESLASALKSVKLESGTFESLERKEQIKPLFIGLLVACAVAVAVAGVGLAALFTGCGKMTIKKKQHRNSLVRELAHQQNVQIKRTQENDAVVRFYAMLNVMVTMKGRPTYDIDKRILDLRVKQPLEMAFYKIFQAVLNYPSTRSLDELVRYTCHDVLYEEIENIRIELGLQKQRTIGQRFDKDGKEIITAYQRKARECRMKIYEDTISRFYSMLELYTPIKMRPRFWEEQSIPEEYWNQKIRQPIKEAFQTFISVMRQYPTKISKQQFLVDYTLNTILPNCETGMALRGIRYELTCQPPTGTLPHASTSMVKPHKSIWEPSDDDMKIALGYHKKALSKPSASPESREAEEKYKEITGKASVTLDRLNDAEAMGRTMHYNKLAHSKSLLQYLAEDLQTEEEEDFQWFRGTRHTKSQISPTTSQKRSYSAGDTGLSHRPQARDPKQHSVRIARSSSSLLVVPEEELREHTTRYFSYRRSPLKQRAQLNSGKHSDISDTPSSLASSYGSSGYPKIHRHKRPLKPALVKKTESPVLGLLTKSKVKPTDGRIRYEYHAADILGSLDDIV